MNDSSTSRDLILSTIHGGGFDRVAPLVRSLNRTGYQGRLVMFTGRVTGETPDQLRQNGVTVVPFHFSGKRDRQRLARLWPVWRWYFGSRASCQAKRRLAHRVFHLRYRRYLLYRDFLRFHGADYDRVLLVDGQDVLFQRDPFSWNPSPGLHCVLEENSIRIGHDRLHRLWMGCQFGADYVGKHAEWVASCSGTTFGDTASIRHYLDRMIAATMSARNLAKISGGDQGIHNHLLIENLLPNVTLHPNRHGPVLTMGVMNPGDVRFNDAGEVINTDGWVTPVLHQYDRLPDVAKSLLAGIEQPRSGQSRGT